MSDLELLAEGFEAHRAHLLAVAYRVLGSSSDAEDAVQESWLRLSRSDSAAITNLGGWLTTVVGRVCLDMLRSPRSRRERPAWEDFPLPESGGADRDPRLLGDADPEQQAELSDAVGTALLVVLETLGPAERLAFVLHDLFAVPYAEIATVLGKSPAAARQLASRARRRVQGRASGNDAGARPANAGRPATRREIVDAFLAASREGDFAALLTLLDPDVVLRADGAAAGLGADAEVIGAQAVARTFSGRAKTARLAMVDGAAGAVWAPGEKPRVVFRFSVLGGKVIRIDLLADPAVLAGLRIEYPGTGTLEN
ncbi:RNA polymerase sigma factor [Arthrobacter sp. NicSoilB4]|uniref:sigma-70 family RNA polymerase sigma factor n=1 Tax=Arthrobacter sp. NicSoilB4 TaxID=2830997 RepID=UPI001CC7374D|nr:sigma-70 family RNA polymerase sigma factor [Arthrobacter sp. NicSoilB4]BCW68131.1 RNA polymerase sigma factor [Arthrobacter sp. NicSoilB4]